MIYELVIEKKNHLARIISWSNHGTRNKKGATKEDISAIQKKIAKRYKPQGVDTKKYCGIINLKEDPMDIQKQLRDEWE